MKILRVLLVCSGNTCRSPMAAALLHHLWGLSSPPWRLQVNSAGISTFAGSAASEHAVQAMNRRGLDIKPHRSQSISEPILRDSDLILTMTEQQKRSIRSVWPGVSDRLFSVGEYAGIQGDIPDPYGGPAFTYEQTASVLERLLQAVVRRIQAEG
jgi:protein-tyrosine-phosphatase